MHSSVKTMSLTKTGCRLVAWADVIFSSVCFALAFFYLSFTTTHALFFERHSYEWKFMLQLLGFVALWSTRLLMEAGCIFLAVKLLQAPKKAESDRETAVKWCTRWQIGCVLSILLLCGNIGLLLTYQRLDFAYFAIVMGVVVVIRVIAIIMVRLYAKEHLNSDASPI